MNYLKYEVKVYDDGAKWWYLDGKLHREDGPAIEWADGSKEWHLNDKLHREDGPAVEYANGGKSWWMNGKYHRTDGPAVECANGSKKWYLNGEPLNEAEFNQRRNSCDGKVVEIDGKRYKLTEM